MAYAEILSARRTLMVFPLLLYLSSPNFPFVFDVKQLSKVKFVVYYVMTKVGANK